MSVIIYSGGMDSFTLLNELYRHNTDRVGGLKALSFDYGQRHSVELRYAERVCRDLGIEHHIIDLKHLQPFLKGSALTDSSVAVPLGHYADESMKKTVVPNRNMIMLSIACGYAVANHHTQIFTAVHAGDHAIYPDCRPEFITNMNVLTRTANYQPVHVEAPYIFLTKAQILQKGLALHLDYSLSWTCYQGRFAACGKCGSCTERLEAFAENSAKDPLAYEALT